MPSRATRSVADEANGWVWPSGNGSPGCRPDRSDEGSAHAVRRGDNTGGAAPWTGPGAEARRESPCSSGPQASGGAHNGLSQVCAPSAAAAQRGARLTGRTTLTRAARSARLAGVDGGRDDHASPTTHGEQAARPSRSCRSRSAPRRGRGHVSALDPQDGGVGAFAAQHGCTGIARRSVTCGLSASVRVVWSPSGPHSWPLLGHCRWPHRCCAAWRVTPSRTAISAHEYLAFRSPLMVWLIASFSSAASPVMSARASTSPAVTRRA